MTQRWVAQIATPEALVTKYDNDVQAYSATGAAVDQPEDEIWARVTIKEDERTQRTLGSKRNYRTIGILFVQTFSPRGLGDGDHRALVDKVVDAFTGVTDTGVTFRTSTPVPVGRPKGMEGNWWQINVNCPFYYDEINS